MSKTTKAMGWRDIPTGAVAPEPRNASQYHTGDWRSQRPVFDPKHCIKCGLCYVFCPDAAIVMNAQGYPEIRLDYCKGCGICAKECFMAVSNRSCFHMKDEEEFH